jgi:hypothetical protein
MAKAAIACCLCIGVSWQTTTLYAKEPEPLTPGARIRVTAPTQASRQIVGILTSVDPSVLTVQTSKEFITVRREAIRTLELSERRGRKGKGALIGAGVGLLAAALVAATTKQGDFLTPGESFLAGVILFIPTGTGLGALLAPGERWVPVPAAALRPTDARYGRAGFQVALRVRF